MATVYDRWHLSRPKRDAEPCAEHSSKTRTLVPSKDHGKGKRWQVRWRDAAGEQQKENFAKRSQADTRADTIGADLARGLYVDPAAGKESFRAVGERWRTTAVHRDGTASRVERALRLHIYPTFADRPIVTIRPSEVQAWVKDRSQVLAPSTLRVTYAYLVTIMHTAVRDRTIAVNPCAGIKLPEVRRAEIVPLHKDAVHALIEAAPPRFRAMILLAVASGLRQGEIFGLEVDCIDFLRREVTVRQQLITPDKDADADEGETPEPYLGEPKTHESYRTVPLVGLAVDAWRRTSSSTRPPWWTSRTGRTRGSRSAARRTCCSATTATRCSSVPVGLGCGRAWRRGRTRPSARPKTRRTRPGCSRAGRTARSPRRCVPRTGRACTTYATSTPRR